MRQVSFLTVQRRFSREGADFPIGLRREYGDLFYGRPLILPLTFFVLHPNHVHELLVSQSDKIEKPKLITSVLRSAFGNGLFTSGGALWKRQRRLMQPVFHHARIGKFAEQMVTHTQAMLANWQDGETRLIDADMHALTLTIVVDALFSTNVADEATVVGDAMHDLAAAVSLQGSSALLTFMPDWMPLPIMRRKRRGVKSINRIVYRVIAERRAAGEAASPPDLLSALLFTPDGETGDHMADSQVRDELMTLFIAGHETTAVLLGWVWALLAKHPQAEAKLHAELDSVLAGRTVTLTDLPNLPYTQQIVKEALRLYPPAWLVVRQTNEAIKLDGESLPRGSLFFVFPYATQRDERWFADPDDFSPERWEGDFEKSLPKGAYFPFGMGPRICIGNGFAMMEAQLLLATIAQRCQIELLSKARPVNATTTLSFDQPVQVRLHMRT
jgi:cytochrome P450